MKLETLIHWAAAIIATAVAVTVFAYSNFQTKDEASINNNFMEKRLDRIENKLDRLIQKIQE